MPLLYRLRLALNRLLAPLGQELVNRDASPSMAAALHRLRRRGVPVGGLLDVGASDGRWLRLARRAYPEAEALLVEANPVHAPRLRRLAARDPRVRLALVAAAARPGRVYFDDSHAFIGLASETPLAPHYRPVPADTLDGLVARAGLAPPYLLKLDTHGFEMPILDGAAEVLTGCSAVIVEAYNLRALPHTPRFPEVIERLEGLGLQLVGLCEPHHRPRDGLLWQMDLVFQRPEGLLLEHDDPYALYGMRRVPGWRRPEQPVLPAAPRGTASERADPA